MLSPFVLLSVMLAPSLVLGKPLFAGDSLVKMLDAESFQSMLEPNLTNMVAFISPSSSTCQRIASDYEKAALGLHPFVPTFGVDCSDEGNKGLCKEQGIENFPTIKLFPRGKTEPSLIYDDPNESSSAYYYWASRRIPNHVTKHYAVKDIQPWAEKTKATHAVLLLTKEKKPPLLWKVLANKYIGQLTLAYHRDRRGKSSVELGMEAGGKKEAKVLVYRAGSTVPFRYEGINKMDSLSKFFDSIIDGSVDLKTANEQARAEEFVPDEKEIEIERKQEAQRLALAHGGFSSLIDFEKAIQEGHGADYHDVHGYPGMMGEPPARKEKADVEGGETVPNSAQDSSGSEASSRISDEL